MTTTATRTSPEKLNSHFIVFFAIISTSLICIMWPNCLGVVFICVFAAIEFKF